MAITLDNSAHVTTTIARAQPRSCPVCRVVEPRVMYRNAMVPFGGFDFSTPILACASCGAAYAGEALCQKDMDRYYSTLSKYDTPQSEAEIPSLDQARARFGT